MQSDAVKCRHLSFPFAAASAPVIAAASFSRRKMDNRISVRYSDLHSSLRADVWPLLEGELEGLPSLPKRIIKVFLSSTFSGTSAVRPIRYGASRHVAGAARWGPCKGSVGTLVGPCQPQTMAGLLKLICYETIEHRAWLCLLLKDKLEICQFNGVN